MLATGSKEVCQKCVGLLAKESVCHVQLVRLMGFVDCDQDVSECLVKLILLHVSEMQHLPHL